MTKPTTLSNKERLIDLEGQLPMAQKLAECELDSIAACGDGSRWSESHKKLTALLDEKRDLERAIRGQERASLMAEMEMLDKELSKAHSARTAADAALRGWTESEVIQRWNSAPRICRDAGLGYTFEQVRDWIASGKPRAFAPPQANALDDSSWPVSLRFTPSERDQIRAYVGARDQADRALLHWSNIADRRARILNENPELRGTAA